MTAAVQDASRRNPLGSAGLPNLYPQPLGTCIGPATSRLAQHRSSQRPRLATSDPFEIEHSTYPVSTP